MKKILLQQAKKISVLTIGLFCGWQAQAQTQPIPTADQVVGAMEKLNGVVAG